VLIVLDQQHLTEIRQHGERDYPYECCGLLIGTFADGRKVVIETYPISNAREEEAKRNRFLIRPDELMRGEKHAREQALDVIGAVTIRSRARLADLFVHRGGGHERQCRWFAFVGDGTGSITIQ